MCSVDPKAVFDVKQCFCALSPIDQGEVRMVPPSPTATNCEPDQATPSSQFEVPEVWAVQGLVVTP